MRILGIDYGDSRVGIAISDLMGLTAQGLYTISSKNGKQFFAQLIEIINENNVEKIVVGLPKNMDGTIGFRGEVTMDFIGKLKENTNIEIITWDERLSTVSAKKALNEVNVRGKKRKQILDTVSACYILQNYLDSL